MCIWIGQMKITIAKLEGMFAVCKQKDKTEIFVNRRELPFDAKEGDVLVLGDDNIWKYYTWVKIDSKYCVSQKMRVL